MFTIMKTDYFQLSELKHYVFYIDQIKV